MLRRPGCAMRTLGRNLRVSYFAYGISVLAALLAVMAIPSVNSSEPGLYNPDVVAATAVLPSSAHIPVTRADGITHVIAAPGSGGFDFFGSASVIGGQASAIHLSGWTIDEMLIRKSAAMVLHWPQMQTRSFDLATLSVRQRPFTEVQAAYDNRVTGLGDWIERARHYPQAMGKGSAAHFERD